ncbi:hypothetical protein [Rhodococcus aerolatus]
MQATPYPPPVRFPVVVRRRASTRVGLTVLTALFAGVLLWPLARDGTRSSGGEVLGGAVMVLIAVVVLVQVNLFRVVIDTDRVEVRGLTGRAVLPLAGLLRVEKTYTSRRTSMPFPFVRASGVTRTVTGRATTGQVRRAAINAQLCDTRESDPALDALLRQFPHLDADVQGADVPWVRWYDRPLGKRPAPRAAPPGLEHGWGATGGTWREGDGAGPTRGAPPGSA